MNKTNTYIQKYNTPVVENRDLSIDTLRVNNRIFRIVYDSTVCEKIPHYHSIKKLISNNNLVNFEVLSPCETKKYLTAFSSYLRSIDQKSVSILSQEGQNVFNSPEDWTSSMWIDAAKFSVTIALELLEDALELHNITAADLQFIQTKPLFINPSKIRTINKGSCTWADSNNFRNRFINPIIRFLEIGIPFQQSLLFENGVEPESLFKEAGLIRSFSPALFTNALVPSILNKQSKKRGFFFSSEHSVEEIVEYRKNLYKGLLKELGKIEENNITKTRTTETSNNTLAKEIETWLKEKINYFHPNSFLEINSQNTTLTQYASEIGIECVSLQKEESLCDRLFRESRKLRLNNLCLNNKVTKMQHSKFAMVLLNKEEYESATLQSYNKPDLNTLFDNLSSEFLIVQSDETNWGPSFAFVESHAGFSLFKKMTRQD